MDGSGNVIVTGDFTGTVDFGGGALTSAGSRDVFVAKLDAGGNHLWSQRFGDGNSQYVASVAVDGSGNIIVAGYFFDTVDFGGGALTSAGKNDIFVVRFDSDGAHLWSQRVGDSDEQNAWGVAVDGSGNIIVTGGFYGTADFGGGALTSAGDVDIFVAKFGAADVAVAISSFDARAFEGGVVLYSSFASNLRVLGVNVYRAEDSGRLFLYENVSHSGDAFYYEDHNIEPGRTYQYQIGVVDDDGEFFSQIVTVTAPGYETALQQNAPNPFNPTTTIYFTLENAVHVTLAIYDAKGRQVTTLIDDLRSAGPHEAQWNGTDSAGSSVSSGVYFYRIKAGKTSLSRRMVLLK